MTNRISKSVPENEPSMIGVLISSRFCSVFCFSRPRIDFSSWELAVPLVQRTCCTSLRLSRPLTSLSPKCFECRSNVREEVCHPGAGVVQHKRTQITQRDPTLAAHCCWILVNKVVRSQGQSLLGVVPWCTLHRGVTFGSTCIAFSSSSSLVRGLPTRYVGNTFASCSNTEMINPIKNITQRIMKRGRWRRRRLRGRRE